MCPDLSDFYSQIHVSNIITSLDDLNVYLKAPKSKFNVIHVNIRSMRANFDNFISQYSKCIFDFSVIIMSEIWIYSEESKYYKIQGFNPFFCCRNDNRSGGLAVFVNNSFDFVEIYKPMLTSESLTIHDAGLNICLVCVYRSHNFTINEFNSEFFPLLGELNFDNIVLMGDLNIDILNDDNCVLEYLNSLSSFGFLSLNYTPTRVQNTATCIDHIFVKLNSCFSVSSAVLENDLTDHFLIIGMWFEY